MSFKNLRIVFTSNAISAADLARKYAFNVYQLFKCSLISTDLSSGT